MKALKHVKTNTSFIKYRLSVFILFSYNDVACYTSFLKEKNSSISVYMLYKRFLTPSIPFNCLSLKQMSEMCVVCWREHVICVLDSVFREVALRRVQIVLHEFYRSQKMQ